jgi:branched-chain amino acid transport system ATP-binding protein
MLKLINLTKYFHGLVAVNNLSFEIKEGELAGLIGPNGAGKTTAFNLISGVYRPNKGKVIFRGHDITGKKPSSIAALGLVRTFQSNLLFDSQTCFENVMTANHLQQNLNFLDLTLRLRGSRIKEEKIRRRAEQIMERMGLKEVKEQRAESLSHGLKRVLGVCIALATNPRMLLLDEPVTGMSHKDIQVFKSLIQQIKNQGVTILLVEHNLRLVMEICNRIIVMNFGNKIAEGTSNDIKSNEDVIEAYLGG